MRKTLLVTLLITACAVPAIQAIGKATRPPAPINLYVQGALWDASNIPSVRYSGAVPVYPTSPSNGTFAVQPLDPGCRWSNGQIHARLASGTCTIKFTITESQDSSYKSAEIIRTISLATALPKVPVITRSVRVGNATRPLPLSSRIGNKTLRWRWQVATPSKCRIKNNKVLGIRPGYCKLMASTDGVSGYVSGTNRGSRVVKVLK